MPQGRNSVYHPATLPVFDPEGIRGKRKIYKSGANELPPFSVTGFVDGTGTSPAFPVRQACTVRHCAVDVEATGGTSISFDILVNYVVVISHVASTAGLTIHTETPLPLALNDVVSAAVTDCGSGDLYNLLIVLRL